eukprot:scaffold40937_cov19-Prasinocladus_malaysianus.AAC.1
MFGGTDGGASKHSRNGYDLLDMSHTPLHDKVICGFRYEAKYEMDEFWEFDLETNQWRMIKPGPAEYQPKVRVHLTKSSPGVKHGSGMVVTNFEECLAGS